MGKHDELSETAIHWLHKRGCQIFDNEVPTWNGTADALGVKDNDVYYIEAKASRSDLICHKQKGIYHYLERFQKFYKEGSVDKLSVFYANDIDFFYLIVADGVKVEKDLYPDFGVIDERGKVIRRAKRQEKVKGPSDCIRNIGHSLAYKVFGKLYMNNKLS